MFHKNWAFLKLIHLLTAFAAILSAGGIAFAQVGVFTDVTNIGPIGLAGFDFGLYVPEDGLTVYFTQFTGDVSNEDMWMTTRTSVNEPFGNVRSLRELNSTVSDDMGSLSADGLTIYFGSARAGGYDMFQAHRNSVDEPFGDPELMGPGVNTRFQNSPRVTPDGLTMVYFSVADLLTEHDGDIWIATRESADEQFGNARPLELNTDANDVFPSISADGLFVFTSDWPNLPPRDGGEGAEDLYVSLRNSVDEPFSPPFNIDVIVVPANDGVGRVALSATPRSQRSVFER